MARRGQRTLQAPYGTDDNDYNNYRGSPRQLELLTHREALRNPSRLDVLEERLAKQERNTEALIDRAFKIKEDVIDSLNFTHGTWQEEKHSRTMLQEHIRTITAVVNKLNSDIAMVDEQLRSRDSATVGTNQAVKNLEVHHVASLTDLRGRIVRCDTSIAKLSTDLRSAADSVKTIIQQIGDLQNKMTEKMHGLEARIVAVSNQQDRVNSEQKMKMTHLESDTGQNIAGLDNRTRSLIDDLKNTVHVFQAQADSEREKLEARVYSNLDKLSQAKDNAIDKVERKMDENHYVTDARLQKLEEAIIEERARISELQNQIENKLMTRLDVHIRQQHDEFSKLKRECREGFATVHESISNMKTVMEGKRKLLEDQLRKDISQIRKMVVLV